MVKNANRLRGLFAASVIVWSIVGLTGLPGCARKAPSVAATPKSVADFFDVRLGDKIVRVQLAVTGPEMERGLMERRDLGKNEGMIFVYERPQQLSYWMRNTPTPLDIGYFDAAGKLQEIYPLLPYDETGVRSRNHQLQFALEMNQGWYRENGIKPGAQLDLDGLSAGLRARGFSPEKFNFVR
jgi:uncharacterized membrane protein (UPF0127 family)